VPGVGCRVLGVGTQDAEQTSAGSMRCIRYRKTTIDMTAIGTYNPFSKGSSIVEDRAVSLNVNVDKAALAELCKKRHIKKLALFGSVLRPDFRDDSDVDVLVEFKPGLTPGFGFFAIQDELSELLGRKVDLNTPQFLSPYFRDRVIEEAETQYAEG
jgi:predicted nucleotidyltransferase